MLPAVNIPESMKATEGPGPEAHNRPGSFIGPMAASFEPFLLMLFQKVILRQQKYMGKEWQRQR